MLFNLFLGLIHEMKWNEISNILFRKHDHERVR